jgi:23S rRNA (cytidine1920-2'-O)/16S rRNA (cytidine1409-2'-O)-methyltransferase
MSRLRLDEALVQRGLYATRSRARDAVIRGKVLVAGKAVVKPGHAVAPGTPIEVEGEGRAYVSRGALKLIHALDHFGWSPKGLSALDIGASTGGFTEVLLERGARHVTAIDSGHGQFADGLRHDPRVTLIEGLNARDLTIGHLEEPPQFVTADVSFISLKLALLASLDLAEPGARLLALVKPQFEVGREGLGKSGIVRSAALHREVCDDIAAWLRSRGWQVAGLTPSPIEGADGNREFFIAAEKPC